MTDRQTANTAILPYFGYGTLLGETHMRERYPSAETIGIATYEGHELSFSRYATPSEGGCSIAAKPGAQLLGVLYRLSEKDMARLLAVGGDAEWYEAREIEVIGTGGDRVRAITLRVDGDRGPWVPPDPYVRLIIQGSEEAHLPEDYRVRLEAIISAAQSGTQAEYV